MLFGSVIKAPYNIGGGEAGINLMTFFICLQKNTENLKTRFSKGWCYFYFEVQKLFMYQI